jgi:hypothetical protein
MTEYQMICAAERIHLASGAGWMFVIESKGRLIGWYLEEEN